MNDTLKLYIAVLDSVPSYMVPTLVAHAVLSAHLRFDKEQDNTKYHTWLQHSFAKVLVKVNQKEFDKICALRCHLAYEKAPYWMLRCAVRWCIRWQNRTRPTS